MNYFRSFLSILSLCATAIASASPGLTLEAVAERSSLWPFYISVVDDVDSIPASARKFPGVLIRIEDDKALIDFGRDGVHAVDIAATNLLEASVRIQNGETEADLANFTRYTTNIFFGKNSNDAYAPIPVDTLATTERYLIVYANARLLEEGAFFDTIDALLKESDAAGNTSVVLGLEPNFYKTAASMRIDWMMVQPHSSIAYRDALMHQPGEGVTIALIDAYGKVLRREVFSYDDLLDRALMDDFRDTMVSLSENTSVKLPQFQAEGRNDTSPFIGTVPYE